MSDITAVETPAVFKVKITGPADLRAVAPVFGITVQDGPGALPKRQLLVKVREAVKEGKAELIETDYFGVDAVLNATGGKGNAKLGGWKISYRVVDAETRKPGDTVQNIVVDRDKIKALIPDANMQGAKLNGVIALVMVAQFEGASIAELPNYVVTDVVRMEAVTAAEVSGKPAETEDTGEKSEDADKATEPVEEVKPSSKAEEKSPELVPADGSKVTAKRASTRKTAGNKTASK